ncbi:MAG: BolA family protein [Pseudomonadota bacterium]|jgi:BolA protein
MPSITQRIEDKLRAGLAPLRLDIIDESHLHQGHAGHRPGGETHFKLVIVSPAFAGLGRVARQRLVHGLLKAELDERVHALSLSCRTPEEAALTP